MTSREFAIQVVKQLQAAGYQALWAGGCVRDQMIGKTPKDYDVATNATPEQVRDVFGHKKTLAIGAAFGVITVMGPKSAEPIEVATFRRDTGYSDGRRPDAIEFTDAREDAIRRDFTINGMFFDPIKEQVLDYVGGQEDLAARQIRAIGSPHERIDEDKLRMLRGVRFASTFGFELESETLAAIQQHAHEIDVVSGERIGAEMRRMLGGPNRAIVARLMRESGLLAQVLPDGQTLYADEGQWSDTINRLNRLSANNFVCSAVVLLEPIVAMHGIEVIFQRWKLSSDERKSIDWICKNWRTLEQADELSWSQVQPILLKDDSAGALDVAQANHSGKSNGVEFCRKRLTWESEKLNPKPLLDGAALIKMGVQPGPQFKMILNAVRAGQLDGEINSVEAAVEHANRLVQG